MVEINIVWGDRLLFVALLAGVTPLAAKKFGKLVFASFLVLVVYLAVSIILSPLLGFDEALLTPSLYLLILGPILIKTDSYLSNRFLMFIVLAYLTISIYDLNALWFNSSETHYLELAHKLGYGRDGLPHFGPLYIPLGVLLDHHTTSWVFFIFSLFYFRRNIFLSLTLAAAGVVHLSLTNVIAFLSCIIYLNFETLALRRFKIIVIRFVGVMVFLYYLNSLHYFEFVTAKFGSSNTENFHSWTSLKNFIDSLPSLAVGHGGFFGYDIVRSEVALVKIVYSLGLPLLMIVVINYFRAISTLIKGNEALVLFFFLTLFHYGVSFRFVPFVVFIVLISNDINKRKQFK